MLLSFAQFEREITGERIRDKVAASKKRGILRIPIQSGRGFRFDVGRRSDFMSATIPK